MPNKRKSHPRKRKAASGKNRKWSAGVTENSNALDLDKNVFTLHDPDQIARSLENSAEKSTRKKGSSYQSAMSMLNFYINRAGKNLPVRQKKVLTKAKDALKELHQNDLKKLQGKNSGGQRHQEKT
jgi:putative cell wall-binding protein